VLFEQAARPSKKKQHKNVFHVFYPRKLSLTVGSRFIASSILPATANGKTSIAESNAARQGKIYPSASKWQMGIVI